MVFDLMYVAMDMDLSVKLLTLFVVQIRVSDKAMHLPGSSILADVGFFLCKFGVTFITYYFLCNKHRIHYLK